MSSAPLAPKPFHDLPRDGDIVSPKVAAAFVAALPKDSRAVLSAVASTSPLLRYFVGMAGNSWKESDLYAHLPSSGIAIEEHVAWTSGSERIIVSEKDYSSVVVHPSLRTKLVDDGSSAATVITAVPEYDICLTFLPFKRDNSWPTTFLRKKAVALGPCVRSLRGAYNRHVSDALLQEISENHDLESIELIACNISLDQLNRSAADGKLKNLRSLRLAVYRFENPPDAFAEHLPKLRELSLVDISDNATYVLQYFKHRPEEQSLTSLEIRQCKGIDETLVGDVIAANKGLKSIILVGDVALTQQLDKAATTDHADLVEIGIRADAVGTLAGITDLAGVFSRLRSLKLYGGLPDSTETAKFVKNYASRLETITVFGSGVRSGSLKSLAHDVHQHRSAVHVVAGVDAV